MIGVVEQRRSMADTEEAVRREQREHRDLIGAFHRLFHASRQTHGMTLFEGVPVIKNPLDLWVYGEIIWDLRPTLLIETGTAYGGSALYYARQMDRAGEGHVVSIDLEPWERLPSHPRVTYVRGYSSVDEALVRKVGEIAAGHPRVMVSLDSCHEADHVAAELGAYGPMVTPEQFLVVEDTDLNGRPVDVGWQRGPGPGPALDAWLPDHPEFERAVMAERYLISSHTWLRRRGTDEQAAED